MGVWVASLAVEWGADVVVIEDFILRVGDPGLSSGRDGLSAVRVGCFAYAALVGEGLEDIVCWQMPGEKDVIYNRGAAWFGKKVWGGWSEHVRDSISHCGVYLRKQGFEVAPLMRAVKIG